MGTEVQSKGYLPGYHSMRDLNEDSTSCNWPLFYEDKTLSNGHYCDDFLQRAASDAYDKDVLKQKMLEHEAIFRNQVYELHRVYRIQRDLMEEIKRRELHGNRIPTESSLSSSPLGYQTTPGGIQKWKNPSFPLPNTVDGRSSISGASATASPLNYTREKNAQSSHFAFQNEGNSRNSDVLESRPQKVRRKLLDLELPASEYIDTEDGEHAKEDDFSGSSTNLNDRNCGNHDNGARIFLNNGVKNGNIASASGLQSKNGLADLNEPVRLEGTNFAVGKLGQVSCDEESLHTEQQSQFVRLPKEAVLNSHHVNGMPINLQLKSQENDKGWLSRVLQAGHNNDKINRDLSRDGRDLGSEAPERGYRFPGPVRSDSITPSQIPSPYFGGPSSNLAHPWSHGVSSWETQSGSLRQNVTNYMHPCFKSSSLSMSSQPSNHSHGVFSNGWHNIQSNQNFGSELLKQNRFYLGSSSGSKELPVSVPSLAYGYPSCSSDINATSDKFPNNGYAKHYNGFQITHPTFGKDLNLNAVPPNNLSNEQFIGKNVEVIDLESKNAGILPWLRPKSARNKVETDAGRHLTSGEMGFLNSSSQLIVKTESENVATSHYGSSVKSFLHSSDNEANRTEINNGPKILGVPIFEKPFSLKGEKKPVLLTSASSRSSECGVLKSKRMNIVLDINLPCDPEPDLEEQVTAETQVVEKGNDTGSVNFRHQFDLNSFADEDENLLLPRVPPITEKVVVDIDLEAPFIDESEDDAAHIEGPATTLKSSEDDVTHTRGTATTLKLNEDDVTCIEGHATTLEATERNANPMMHELVKVAAEAIVSISSSYLQGNLDYMADKPSEASTPDPLGWFAEIVSSCSNTIISNSDTSSRGSRKKHSAVNENTSAEEIDYFEAMTLELTECREEDYIPKPLVPENIVIEETGTSLLTSRPRRGQARRGRQRRDFQRDILPGLASLSRHEVTEDIQTFGGLMRATGHSWTSRLGRRTSARNGCGRGRRRSRVSSPPAVGTSAAGTPLIQQLNSVEGGLGLEDRNLQGWEKTTRRPRRQRCPPGNLPTLPVT